jgi:hypothetical protein
MVMGLFGKRKHKGWSDPSGDKLAGRIALAIIKRQRKLADWLERKTQYWNKASKLIALYLFCLLFGGLSLWLLMKPFFKL